MKKAVAYLMPYMEAEKAAGGDEPVETPNEAAMM
jgi:cobalamin-dependent methionine synthase I